MAANSSPSKHNPFAVRPAASTTFARANLLPSRRVAAQTSQPTQSSQSQAERPKESLASPMKVQSTPDKTIPAKASQKTPAPTTTPGTKATPKRQAWRLLWRGGLEVGPDGWRLDGATFVAHLAFPATPSASLVSPAFGDTLPAGDTDLCLSLESMRGRKYLPVRSVISLADDDIEVDDAGVQLSITSPLLSSFFTSLLCRNPKLTPLGKTTTGIVIGLGDEGVDPTSSMIVYGQRQAGEGTPPTLRLCVGRKRVVAPPSAKKVRPGEPLPRAPHMFPRGATRRPPPIPRHSLSRATSVSSIYAPPVRAGPLSASASSSVLDFDARRGLKRPPYDEHDERRRKSGRLEEDIFGSKAVPVAGSSRSTTAPHQEPKVVSQKVQDNKATIRKQTMNQLEARGCAREHAEFKDVFSNTTKGVYFALRKEIEGRLDKARIRALVAQHLDMYFPCDEDSDGTECSERDIRDLRTPSPRR